MYDPKSYLRDLNVYIYREFDRVKIFKYYYVWNNVDEVLIWK
jgi:hypothetical protein